MSFELRRLQPWAFDATVALVCLFVGWCIYFGAWQGQEHVMNLGSDAGNIAGFIAATERPDLFARDEALGDPHNFQHYLTVQIPSAIFLSRWTGGDYGWAFLLPLPWITFLQLFGFYLFGHAVLRSRPLALALSGLSLLEVPLSGLGEYWGTRAHATPREWFQALLPFILLAAWKWRHDVRAWAAVFFTMGLMMYVHPVSAPGWTVALGLGFLALRPEGRAWPRHVGLVLAASPAFFVSALPFVLNYLGSHEHGTTKLPYEQVFAIIADRFASGYLDLPSAISRIGTTWFLNGVIPAGVIGVAVGWYFDRERRREMSLALLWLAGLLFMATLVPITEQAICAHLKMMPVEVDLVRGLRYVVPLLQLFALWGVATAVSRLPEKTRQLTASAIAAVLVLTFATVAAPPEQLANGYAYLIEGARKGPSHRLTALLAVRKITPEGSTILPSSDGDALVLRYLARRAVVYAWKDGGILGYANHEALVQWYGRAKEIKRISRQAEPKRSAKMIDAARRYDADYLFYSGTIDPQVALKHRASVVFSNKRYTLLRVD